MPRICPKATTVTGIDVSHHNGAIRWADVKAAGVDFAFVRVSDGLNTRDRQFRANWDGAKAAGLLRGAYQYFRPAQDTNAQADILIAAVKQQAPGDLPPVIDVEVASGLAPAAIAVNIQRWLARVENALGVRPIIYTGPAFWREHVKSTVFVRYPLWIANYTTRCPDVPAPWPTWAFWQHTERGKVSGAGAKVDVNKFNGTLAELRTLAGLVPLRVTVTPAPRALVPVPLIPPPFLADEAAHAGEESSDVRSGLIVLGALSGFLGLSWLALYAAEHFRRDRL